MSRSMLFYLSNILLVFYLILAMYSIVTKNRNSRLLFSAISGLLFGIAMSIILFWLPYDADLSFMKKSIYSLLLTTLLIVPFLLSWKWNLDGKIRAMFEKKKKR